MKRNTLCLSLLLGLGICSTPVHALDLVEAFNAALLNDPTYQVTVAQKAATDAQRKQARAALMPTIGLTGSFLHTNTRNTSTFLGTSGTSDVRKTYPANLTISFTQPLLEIDKITAFKQIDLNTDSGALQLAQARQDLINRVIQAYFNALLAEKNATIAAEQERNTALQLKIVKRSFDVGNTTIIDTNEAEAAYYRAKAAAINAASTAENARSALADMMGRDIDPKEKLATLSTPLHLKMPVPDTQDKWVARARDESYAIQIAKLAYKVAELDVTRKAQQHLPVVNFVANQVWKSTSLNRASDVSTSAQSFGFEVSMPIFDGGLIGAQVLESEALKTKSYQNLRAVENQVAQTTRTAYNQAVSGLATIAALQAAQKSASASVKSNEIGRSLGMRINIDVLNAEQTHAQTQYDLAQAVYNTVLGNVNLKAAISKLGDEDVVFINSLLDTKPQPVATQNPSLLQDKGLDSGDAQHVINRTQDPKTLPAQ
ncbi:TolC family outer membrane protein [Hydromonas duriensis]|uniref:Outer membrane protein n=1 Tax=Hydromonas duriensis TaxID=1527608 RepID=A0A4R6Y7X3_9BURK|nr:TolC family outer membrane protein [Hydromonas duriensis]TDR31436.1 outer membrane protein [Hydromonas duriensis]